MTFIDRSCRVPRLGSGLTILAPWRRHLVQALAQPVVARVLVVSASVGAGHDGAAHELAQRLRRQGAEVEVRDFLDALPAWLRFTVREGYAGTVNHTPWFYDWLYAAMEKPGLVQSIGMLICRLAQSRVLRWCTALDPDAVVSTYPLASQTLGQLVRKGLVAVPTTTYLTDPSVHALWVNKHIGRHLTTMPATAALGERLYGVPMTVAGPLVAERFTAEVSASRRAQLQTELGLDRARPVALVLTGSLGLGRVEETVDAIAATGVATPLVLCGRNARLRRTLLQRQGVVAVGWRDDVHDLMRIADVMVHNAGGMSFSESLVAGLPAVTFRCIPGHGRANGEVLARAGVAPLAETVEELAQGLRAQLRPAAAVVLRETIAAAAEDASGVVLRDVRTESTASRRRATRARRRHVSVRRRVSALGAAALVATTSLAATEGVAAATRHGFGVAHMPVHAVALVVAPESLAVLQNRGPQLAAAHTSILVPHRPTRTDVRAAARLAAAGVTLLAPGCPPSTLLAHPTARSCGAGKVMARAGVHISPIVVSDGEVEGPALVVARRDRTRIVIGEPVDGRGLPPHRTPPGGVSGVWLLRQPPSQTPRALRAAIGRQIRAAKTQGLRLRPVTDASTAR
jgi:processive 1,2-diacylglycerol beta-glucosyltransferase